jgi:hypothetical protein
MIDVALLLGSALGFWLLQIVSNTRTYLPSWLDRLIVAFVAWLLFGLAFDHGIGALAGWLVAAAILHINKARHCIQVARLGD